MILMILKMLRAMGATTKRDYGAKRGKISGLNHVLCSSS
jgi:hypothetical protein